MYKEQNTVKSALTTTLRHILSLRKEQRWKVLRGISWVLTALLVWFFLMALWVTIGYRVRISPVFPMPPMLTERDPTYCHQVSLRATNGRLVDSRAGSPHMILKATTVFFCQHPRKHEGRSHTCHQRRSFTRSTRVGCWGTPQPALIRHFTYKWMNEWIREQHLEYLTPEASLKL